MSDPRDAPTLGEACSNGDGTYNAFKMLSWMSKALAGGGPGLSEEEVRKIYEDSKVKRQNGK